MKNKQMTLASSGFEKYTKTTRRAQFLAQMDRIVPWAELCALIDPVYPKAGNGRPPIDLELMLCVYFLQHGFNLSDPAVEEALDDSLAMRAFAGVDLGRKPAPDETTVCNFRHLLERHDLGKKLFEQVGRHLQAKGIKVSKGTIVDTTIINAPSSTKNASGERDPEMHQTKKGNPWYFGMKAHIGVDKKPMLIHSVAATPANVADGNMLEHLLHGKETHVWGDAAYAGRTEHIRAKAPKARARNRRHQAPLRLHQGALPRHRQERQAPVRDLRAGQSLPGAAPLVATAGGVVRPESANRLLQSPNRQPKSTNSCPTAALDQLFTVVTIIRGYSFRPSLGARLSCARLYRVETQLHYMPTRTKHSYLMKHLGLEERHEPATPVAQRTRVGRIASNTFALALRASAIAALSKRPHDSHLPYQKCARLTVLFSLRAEHGGSEVSCNCSLCDVTSVR